MSERPQVGDRVLVSFEATVVATDNSEVPFLVRRENETRAVTWLCASDVTILPPPRPVGPPGMDEAAADLVSNHDETVVAAIERSPTAIELRLRKLEEDTKSLLLGSTNVQAFVALIHRVEKLEQDSRQHSTTLTAFLIEGTAMERLGRLERQVASIRSALNNLAEE